MANFSIGLAKDSSRKYVFIKEKARPHLLLGAITTLSSLLNGYISRM